MSGTATLYAADALTESALAGMDREALVAEVRRLRAALDTVRPFLCEIFGEREDWDGGDLQYLGLQHGVLEEVTANTPCGERCPCADEFGSGEPEWVCYRLHPSLTLETPRALTGGAEG